MPVIIAGSLYVESAATLNNGYSSFQEFQKSEMLKWVHPDHRIDPIWKDHRGHIPVALLGPIADGVFLAGQAREWDALCIVDYGDTKFPTDRGAGDYRAIILGLTLRYIPSPFPYESPFPYQTGKTE